MAKTSRKVYEEFKREVVTLSYSSGKTIKEVAADLGIHRSLLNKWRADVRRLGERAFPGHGVQRLTPQEEENLRLKRELAIVTEKIDILNKAVAIFSKKPK